MVAARGRHVEPGHALAHFVTRRPREPVVVARAVARGLVAEPSSVARVLCATSALHEDNSEQMRSQVE